MSYFLKQTKIKNRIYLQISMTTYDSHTKRSSNKCYKKIGFLDEQINLGIKNPIEHYKEEIKVLNKQSSEKLEEKKSLQITDKSTLDAGLFLPNGIANSLHLEERIYQYCIEKNGPKNLHKIIKDLMFARILDRNAQLDKIIDSVDFKNSDVLEVLDFIGKNYHDFINLLSKQIQETFNTSQENIFYDFSKTIMSSKKSDECIESLLFFNSDLIPVGFELQKAESSSKSSFRTIINNYKKDKPASRFVHVSDRGINYGNNINFSLQNKEGYIFPFSLSKLDETEKEWILDNSNYSSIVDSNNNVFYKVKATKGEYFVKVEKPDGTFGLLKTTQKRVASFDPELAKKKLKSIDELVDQARTLFYLKANKQDYGRSLKYIKITSEIGKEDKIEISQDKINNELKYSGYKMIVTSELGLKKKDIFYIYDTIWKTQDYFRNLKYRINESSYISNNTNRIFGTYILGFYTISIFRLLEEKVFKRDFTSNEIRHFIKEFKILFANGNYINLLNPNANITKIEGVIGITITKLFFSKSEIEKLNKLKIKES